MKRLMLFSFLLFMSFSVIAEVIRYDNFKEDQMDKDQIKMVQERMEEEPSSTAIGGSRGGQLEIEKNRDDQRAYDIEKQRQLYESEGKYREGL